MSGQNHLLAGRTVCTLLPELLLILLFLRLMLNNHFIYIEKLSLTYRRVKLPATFRWKTKWLMKVTRKHPALLQCFLSTTHPWSNGFSVTECCRGNVLLGNHISNPCLQLLWSGPQSLVHTVTTTAILGSVIWTVMTIYKAHTKVGKIVGSKIKILILHWECPQVLCPRRILGFYIHEYASYSPKFKTHFNKCKAHSNKNLLDLELL